MTESVWEELRKKGSVWLERGGGCQQFNGQHLKTSQQSAESERADFCKSLSTESERAIL